MISLRISSLRLTGSSQAHARRLLAVVGGQVGQQRADIAHEILLGLGREARHAALAGMDAGATEVLGVDILARDGLDDLRAGEKHIAGLGSFMKMKSVRAGE